MNALRTAAETLACLALCTHRQRTFEESLVHVQGRPQRVSYGVFRTMDLRSLTDFHQVCLDLKP